MVNQFWDYQSKGEIVLTGMEQGKARLDLRTADRAKWAELKVRFVLGLVLGRVRVMGGLSPFGAALVGSSVPGIQGLAALFGVWLGALTAGSFAWAVKYIAMTAIIWATLHFFAKAAPWWFPLAVTFGSALIIGAVYVWDAKWEVTAAAEWVVESFFAAGCVYFFDAALAPWSRDADRDKRAAHSVSLAVLSCALLMGLSSISLFGVLALGRAAAALAVMMLAFRGGAASGCMAGAALGAAMDLTQGGVPFFTVSYALSALLAGVFSKTSRLTFTLAWTCCTALTVIWFWGTVRQIPALYETFAAGVIFMLLPDRAMTRLGLLIPMETPGFGLLKVREYARDRVDQCAAAFKGLYDAVRAAGGDETRESFSTVFDRAADDVCRDCPHAARCWQERYVDTVDVMNHLTAVLKTGDAKPEDLPERFLADCDRPERLLAAVNAEARTYLTRQQYRARLRENRGAAFEQYNDVYRVLTALSRELGGELAVETGLERKLQKFLRGLGMDASAAVFRLPGGRLRAEIRSKDLKLLTRDETWLERLSQVLGVRLCTWDTRDDERLVLLEAEPLAVRVGAAAAKRAGEAVSGDRSLFFRTEEGVLYVLLSDGMGSGPEAARMSAGVLAVLERFLKAGVAPETALGILSDLMLLKSDAGLESATVDLLSLHMFTGQAVLYKFGAAPSYLVRGNSVRRISGGALPVGLAAGKKRQGSRLTLSPGAMLIMASDGLVTGRDDAWLRAALTADAADDERDQAKKLLSEALKHGAGNDDSTVICVRCEERQ